MKIGDEVWTVLRRAFLPANPQLEALAEKIDRRSGQIERTREESAERAMRRIAGG